MMYCKDVDWFDNVTSSVYHTSEYTYTNLVKIMELELLYDVRFCILFSSE